jgi:hypothetical protein
MSGIEKKAASNLEKQGVPLRMLPPSSMIGFTLIL